MELVQVQKVLLTYSHLPNGELNANFGMEDLANGIWWQAAHKSKVEKYFAPFNLEKISSTLGIGQVNFLVTLLSPWYSMTRHFPPSPFGTTIMGADQLDLLLRMTFAVSSFSISSFTHW